MGGVGDEDWEGEGKWEDGEGGEDEGGEMHGCLVGVRWVWLLGVLNNAAFCIMVLM